MIRSVTVWELVEKYMTFFVWPKIRENKEVGQVEAGEAVGSVDDQVPMRRPNTLVTTHASCHGTDTLPQSSQYKNMASISFLI